MTMATRENVIFILGDNQDTELFFWGEGWFFLRETHVLF